MAMIRTAGLDCRYFRPTADLFIRDGIVFGTFSGSLSGGGSELGRVEGELDRFDCLHTDIPPFENLPPFLPQCAFMAAAEFI